MPAPPEVKRATWHGIERLSLLESVPALTEHTLPSGAPLRVVSDLAVCEGGCAPNKVRKLEFLFADAFARGASGVATAVGRGSNFAYATAFLARQVGLEARALFIKRYAEPFSTAVAAQTDPLLTEPPRVVSRLTLPGAYLSLRLRCALGSKQLWLPPGGSNPKGSLGIARSVELLAATEAWRQVLDARAIAVALGSCGTTAGLLAGLALCGAAVPVVAVRVVDRVVANRRSVLRVARGTLALLRRQGVEPKLALEEVPLEVVHRQFGGEYGRPTSASTAAIEAAASVGVSIEPTYTSKALAEVLARSVSGDERPLVFWNTWAGAPSLA